MPTAVYAPSPTRREDAVQDDADKPLPHTKALRVDADSDDDDSSLTTIDSLIRRRARLHPYDHAVSYPYYGIDFVDYNMQQLDVFAWRVAKHYEARLPARHSSEEKPTVVGLLGPSNLEYLITMLALTKLGHTVLLLSTRISQAAIESLLTTTGASALVAEARHQDMANLVRQSMPGVQICEIAARSVFEFPIDVIGDTRLDAHLDPQVEVNNIAWIIHSSGSTGLPKPIYQTQKSCMPNYAMSMRMKAFITLPLFHNHGICNLFRAVYARRSLHMYNADLPLTQDYLIKIMRQHKFEIFYGVPYALKLLAETEEGIRLLQELKIVMYGGSACPDELGNTLVRSGVNLVGHYGATEVGQLMTSFRPPGDTEWNYVREHDRLTPYLRWVPRGPNLYECVVTDGWPAKVQSNQPDGSYATKDLFEPHPTIPRAWKYIARLDDTLVLSNGEKFGPVGMEGQIRSHKNVAEAVVFGAGRPYLGVLVVPAAHLTGKSQEDILDAIWPVVNTANKNVDAFARISKSMVHILPAECVYPRTDKGSIIRQAFYKAFQDQMEQTYDAQDVGSGELQAFELPELAAYIRQLLESTVSSQSEVENDTDFFLLGLDSLQAIQMRSDILKTVDLGGQKLGQNVVFEHPSIEKLSRFLYGLRNGTDSTTADVETEMQVMIDKYGNFRCEAATSVVVTGATGSLGAHVVAQLSANPDIHTIYCLVRSTGNASQALARVKESMLQRKVYHALPLSSRRKIVALSSDLSDAQLGLAPDVYDAVGRNLRAVIHCAWSVNFNMQLTSFEKGNIAGVNHLLALCKSSPTRASMNFCSSVSTCARSTVTPIPETLPILEWAQGMGYAQSKSVAEHVCARAAAQGITSRVLRVGQIAGDTQHGVWNAQEAIPMMMQTAVTIGALPKLPETPSWTPVDVVAAAIADISLSESGSGFTNVTHPKTFSFVDDLLPALRSAGLDFEEVEPKEWVRRLRASNPDPKVNPPIKLVDFFASKYDKDEFAPPKPFATDKACSLSPALANAPEVNASFVKKFIDYFMHNAWQRSGPVERRTAFFMAGPCGTGKTTTGTAIAQWLGVPFAEGDAIHTRAAVEKMRSDTPLSDEDRAEWLRRISARAVETIDELGYASVVVSCSALRVAYRAEIRDRLSQRGIDSVFVDLQAGREVLIERLQARKGHYMSAKMVEGQLEVYEGALPEETDVMPVDAEKGEDEVAEEVKWLLRKAGFA
ncbi:NRPS-like enzyme [Emericellopsis cladophorae]|uniref:gluconokinase n=1 Tax=Emericellopsis cladophorae TaxID=2686198 RepID=A0A9P9Y6A9_9HYPO|nr:NRPS-like enzyme [Emericellopsis cladophorae]KAI6784135.1 NRPS-like enzyme [Emericellopsis cladophorae]